VNAKSILAKVAALPISTWMYNAEKESGVRHIGPVAQDFKKAFGVGYDDKSISLIDASGVALTAIKGLSEIVKEKDARIDKLERELAAIKRKLGM
jgi:trimeric autotransporter adhesin